MVVEMGVNESCCGVVEDVAVDVVVEEVWDDVVACDDDVLLVVVPEIHPLARTTRTNKAARTFRIFNPSGVHSRRIFINFTT